MREDLCPENMPSLLRMNAKVGSFSASRGAPALPGMHPRQEVVGLSEACTIAELFSMPKIEREQLNTQQGIALITAIVGHRL